MCGRRFEPARDIAMHLVQKKILQYFIEILKQMLLNFYKILIVGNVNSWQWTMTIWMLPHQSPGLLKGYSNRTNVYCFCFLHMVNCMTTSIYVDYLRRVASKSYVKTSALINS